MHTIFNREYLEQKSPWKLVRHRIDGNPSAGEGQHFSIEAELEYNGERRVVTAGDGAISAFVAALGVPVRIMDYHEHAIGTGTDTRAASYVELRVGDSGTGFGVGIDRDIVTASFQAVLSAVNRHINAGADATEQETAEAA